MKIGDKVKIIKAFAGRIGCYTESTPENPQFVTLTKDNIDDFESIVRGGLAELVSDSFPKKLPETEKPRATNEDISVLPDNKKTKFRDRK